MQEQQSNTFTILFAQHHSYVAVTETKTQAKEYWKEFRGHFRKRGVSTTLEIVWDIHERNYRSWITWFAPFPKEPEIPEYIQEGQTLN